MSHAKLSATAGAFAGPLDPVDAFGSATATLGVDSSTPSPAIRGSPPELALLLVVERALSERLGTPPLEELERPLQEKNPRSPLSVFRQRRSLGRRRSDASTSRHRAAVWCARWSRRKRREGSVAMVHIARTGETRRLVAVGVLGVLTPLLVAPLQAQAPATLSVNLPSPNASPPGTWRDHNPFDLGRVDVLLGPNDNVVRFVYTTDGYFDLDNSIAFPGQVRFIDATVPIPDLSDPGSWTPAVTLPVSHWNDIKKDEQGLLLGGDVDPRHGKGQSYQGIVSVNGTLFIPSEIRKDKEDVTLWCDPPGPGNHAEGAHHTLWNGFSMLDGTARPDLAFDPLAIPPKGQELWSAGTDGFAPGLKEAVPETVIWTRNGHGRWVFVSNYCGKDAAGYLMVQNISNLQGVDPADRVEVDLYWRLGQYTDGLAQAYWGPFGAEVGWNRFTVQVSIPPDPAYDVRGNKLRPLLTVAPTSGPNAGRRLLICGLNLDPVRLDDGSLATLDSYPGECFPTLDEGKYDYLALIDITDLAPEIPIEPHDEPLGLLWDFAVAGNWSARLRFLRLPPDLPANWDGNFASLPLNSGHDWSKVRVFNPDDSGGFQDVQILGSGTVSSLASSTDGRWLYVVTADQGQGVFHLADAENDHDGGWHVGHLYVIDLNAFDVANQTDIDDYATNGDAQSGPIKVYRLPKIINAKFGTLPTWGATCVASNIPGFPNTGSPIAPTKLDNVPDSQLGLNFPGEYQLDASPWTRLKVAHHPGGLLGDRLLVCANGDHQVSTSDANTWPNISALYVLRLDAPATGVPTYHRTISLPHDLQHSPPFHYSAVGIDVLPVTSTYLGSSMARYVYAITCRESQEDLLLSVNKFMLVQDT